MIVVELRAFDKGENGWEATIKGLEIKPEIVTFQDYTFSKEVGWLELRGLEGLSAATRWLKFDSCTVYAGK